MFKNKIYSSINDFSSLFGDLDYLFSGLKNTGIDGVELVTGIKFRWSAKEIKRLSTKYNLPVVTIHQPVWSGLGLYLDEEFLKLAHELNVKQVVFHPLPGSSFTDPKMLNYFNWLTKIQNKYNIEALLENLSDNYGLGPVAKIFPLSKDCSDVEKIFEAAERFNFRIAYDTSHAKITNPHTEKWFNKIFPKIANIHLSSFDKNRDHLPLNMGDFNTKDFLQYLNDHKYTGKITLEIYYPNMVNLFGYNFNSIKNSVNYLHQA